MIHIVAGFGKQVAGFLKQVAGFLKQVAGFLKKKNFIDKIKLYKNFYTCLFVL